ncbi:hypothetical protein ACFL9U_12900 [Thermodesulfobacteriota bacterium]
MDEKEHQEGYDTVCDQILFRHQTIILNYSNQNNLLCVSRDENILLLLSELRVVFERNFCCSNHDGFPAGTQLTLVGLQNDMSS